MEDHQNNNPSPASSSSSSNRCRRVRRHVVEEEVDQVACTGKSCQSCTAGVIADCVAVCCCPCAVVNLLALAFVKLPWAVARKAIGRRKNKKKKKKNRALVEEGMKKKRDGDRDGISQKGGADEGTTSEIVLSCRGGALTRTEEAGEGVNDHFSAAFKAEEVWLELYEVGHLGFGRVSFTGIPFQNKGT